MPSGQSKELLGGLRAGWDPAPESAPGPLPLECEVRAKSRMWSLAPSSAEGAQGPCVSHAGCGIPRGFTGKRRIAAHAPPTLHTSPGEGPARQLCMLVPCV